jgi:hypothetical protein
MRDGRVLESILPEQPVNGILHSQDPNRTSRRPDGARETVRRTLRDGNRASEVVTRLRALFNKKPPMLELIDWNEAAREITTLLSNGIQASAVQNCSQRN